MASLAGMLQARGHKVTGSDQNVYPPMSTQLEALGIEILNGYKAENADIGADCVVVVGRVEQREPEVLARVEVDLLPEQVERHEERSLRHLLLVLDLSSHLPSPE